LTSVVKRVGSAFWMLPSLLFVSLASGQSQPAWADAFQSAVAQLRQGQTPAALQTFEGIWKNNSNDPQLATWIGASLDSTGHHKQASPWYDRALSINPNFEPALNDLALNTATLGQLPRAQSLLRKALRLNPSNPRAAYNLGLISFRLRNYADAAEAFKQARGSAQAPASLDQLALAEATARFHLRQYSQSAHLLETVGNRQNHECLLLLGSAHALSGDSPSAIRTLQAAVQGAPDDPQGYYRLALVFMLGRLDHEAQNVLAAGLKQTRNSPMLLFAEALKNDMQGKTDQAIAFCKQARGANPRQPQPWALLGKLYAANGATDDALAAYRQAIALASDAQPAVDRAQLLIRLQRLPEAETELRAIAKRYPDSASVDRGLGKLYREERRFELAEKYLRKAISLDPDDSEAYYALGEVLRITGHTDDAKKEFAIFNEKKPAADARRLLELAATSSASMK